MKRFGVKMYYFKMLLWISIAILLVVVLLSAVVGINTRKLLVKNEYVSNQKILYQVKYNMAFMDDAIASLCKSLYLNSDVDAVMYAKQEDMVDVANRLNKVTSSITSTNAYIHSLTIYNRHLNQTYNAGSPLFFEDQMIDALNRSEQLPPKMEPIFRDIRKLVNGESRPERVFSYFMYETSPEDLKPEGVIVINVRAEWLLDNIRQINMIDKRKGDTIFLLDQSGEYLAEGSGDNGIMQALKTDFVDYQADHPNGDPDGFFQSKHGGTEYLVTYSTIESAGMTLLKAQPVEEVYRSIASLRASLILITLLTLLLALVLSIVISRRIYRPLGNLVNAVKRDRLRGTGEDEAVDEISYLNAVYRQSMEELDLFYKEKHDNKDLMKHYWLRRLLDERLAISREELASLFKEMRISLSPAGTHAVCLLKIDNYKEFQQAFNARDKEMFRFAILNIASETVAQSFPNEGIDMKEDHVLLLVSVPDRDGAYAAELARLLAEAQDHFSRFFKVTFTASISGHTDEISGLHALYNQTLDLSMYRLHLGHGSLITHSRVRRNVENKKAGYPKELEEWFAETIKSGNVAGMKEVLANLFGEMETLNYHNALVSIIRLFDTAVEALDEASISPAPSLQIASFGRHVMEKETMAEIHRILQGGLLDSINKETAENTDTLNDFVVDAVTEYIHNHYRDLSLSLPSIAAMMKISSRTLSRIYKQATNLSIADMINDVRLSRAAELLLQEDLSVNEVVQRVGLTNETYFFSLFKKKYKVTPKEYALQRNLNKIN
ncbi:helix-turn-helix domain-containing protein [Paenibacillus sacheonensis]|uniref:Helix-turn-helix domain-containing protein n=1 Tax=Paenibacillus sacheonensis TaxID=742054 RepID=A0A7X5BXL9_9BACL|nr:helix-turn-helix domain-containing protein [Paenibacillus sacheonensis]MBM7565939.1 AraC-like DNA-binding protein [Paenibacillus sacheonensis]NBC68747.1 helix-turn-helix domain-containing protein [Paenibacillus sacheonensis]